MADALIELEALREATRPRLTKAMVARLRDHVEFQEIGDKDDRAVGTGIALLLDMHDRLEAIRNG
jgi:hypothetical protein